MLDEKGIEFERYLQMWHQRSLNEELVEEARLQKLTSQLRELLYSSTVLSCIFKKLKLNPEKKCS